MRRAKKNRTRRAWWVLLVTCLAGFATAEAAQAAYPVKLKVTVERVKALDCVDEDEVLGGCGSEADFFGRIFFDTQEALDTEADVDDDDNEITPDDWSAEKQFNLEDGKVRVDVQLRDLDGAFRGPSEQVDITPTVGRDLTFFVNLAPCAVSGGLTADCAQTLTSTGSLTSAGDADDRAAVTLNVEVIDVDSDGDSLLDGWETRGLDTDGDKNVDVNLPQQGANPQRHDLFLEADCLADRGGDGDLNDETDHTHCPNQLAIADVVGAFANAPAGPRTSNPDGTSGIQLHVDTGPLYGAGLVTPVVGGVRGTYGDLGGGNEIAETPGNLIVDFDGAMGSPAANLYDIKRDNFDARRRFAYRYVLFGHTTNNRKAVNDCTSGWAEDILSNDFLVTLGGLRDDDANGVIESPCYAGTPGNGVDDDGDGATDEDGRDTLDNDADGKIDEDGGNLSVGGRSLQAGTLMHELGHALGLQHGGNDELNNKPNYLSVMNYSFQSCSVWSKPAGAPAGSPALPGGCDYSRDALPALEERIGGTPPLPGLDECRGIDGGVFGFGRSNFNGNALLGVPVFEGGTCPAPNTTNVSFDVNTDTQLTNLPGYDDWDNIRYAFQGSGTFTDGSANPVRNEPDAQILEAARRQMAALVEPDLAVTKTGPADAAPGADVEYEIGVANNGRGPALDVALSDDKPDGSTASFAMGFMPAGATASRTVGFEIPCTARDGAVLTDTAVAVGKDLYGAVEASLANNSASLATTVHAPVLTLAKTASGSLRPGEAITYRLTYENTGSGDASDVAITDTLPADVYYSAALDAGAGPAPSSVVRHPDGRTTLSWTVGAVAGDSGARVIEYTARPSLLSAGGETVANGARLTFTNANGCEYDAVTASRMSTLAAVVPTRDPLSPGYWSTHPEEWTSEVLARIQATDQRFDGADGSAPDGRLAPAEVAADFAPVGTQQPILRRHLLATFFNLASRRISAVTAIKSRTASRLGLRTVRDAARYAMATLSLPVAGNAARYTDAIRVMDEINNNLSEVY